MENKRTYLSNKVRKLKLLLVMQKEVFTCGQSGFFTFFKKKSKSLETRLFQDFEDNFKDKILELVYLVSRTHMHRFFV